MSKKITKEIIDDLYTLLSPCRVCPRKCGVDRLKGEKGNCNSGSELEIASFHQHFGEEPPLVGKHGSGTIFFTHCNLHCVFCQNYQISQLGMGHSASIEECAHMMLRLQDLECHNINFVTPTPWVPQIVKALAVAQDQGLNVPIVYNCGGYESVETLQLLDGIIDIYMPDIKYADNDSAREFSDIADYWDIVQPALKEMHRQVGDLVMENGIAQKGLLIRHLVLPDGIAGSKACFEFIKNKLSPHTAVNVMAQYYPAYNAHKYPKINRRIAPREYQQVLRELEALGLDEGFRQTMDTIVRRIVPEWTDDLKET
ncbi:radical SAM protein [candidate division WOR-3 bacterium]|nr:radical SAM protein [candidate division WOR-3 bacterium]